MCITRILLYSHNHNIDLWTNERTHFFIKNISLTLFSRKGWCFCRVWEMGGDTYTHGKKSSFLYLLPEARGCQRLHHLASRDISDQLRVPRSIAILCTPSKSDHVVLIMWFPSSYTPVRPECPDAPSSLLIKTWQLTKTHGSLGTNRKSMLYVIYNILALFNLQKLICHEMKPNQIKVYSIYTSENFKCKKKYFYNYWLYHKTVYIAIAHEGWYTIKQRNPSNSSWKLHKNTTCCFEQIIEATLYKTVVWPLTSNSLHFYNYWLYHKTVYMAITHEGWYTIKQRNPSNSSWKLHKNTTCCFEQIIEATLYKTVVRPLTSNLTSHLSKIN